MGFVKKCKRVLGSSKRLHPEDTGSGSYGKLSDRKNKKKKEKCQVAPQGYLSVYVGPERQKFVIKIKHANHPLFKAFLDAAKSEYGYRNDGPLCLPCDVDLFSEALAEMDNPHDDTASVGCAFHIGHSHRHASSSVFHSPSSYHSNLSGATDYELLV